MAYTEKTHHANEWMTLLNKPVAERKESGDVTVDTYSSVAIVADTCNIINFILLSHYIAPGNLYCCYSSTVAIVM